MAIVEAKEILVKSQICHMMPVSGPYCNDCKQCGLYVSDKLEQEAFDLIYALLKERGSYEENNTCV